MDGSKARHAACLSTYLVIAIGALSSPTDAKDGEAAAPWSEEACNDVCQWWMKLGGTPAAEGPAEPQPKPAAQALALPAMTILPSSAAKVTIDPFKRADRPSRKVKSIRTSMNSPVATGAYLEPISRWGMPMQGGAPILPAWFEPSR